MKKQKFTTLLVFGMVMTTALGLFDFTGGTDSVPAMAAVPRGTAPTATTVDPSSGSNDLDAPIVISGTNSTNNPAPTVLYYLFSATPDQGLVLKPDSHTICRGGGWYANQVESRRV